MKLSDFEMDVMRVFWQQGELSAPQVHECIAPDREVTYSTVKTIVDRLEQKQALVRSKQEGRTIYYRALVQAEQLSRPLVKSLIQRMFGGSARPLFSHLFANEKLSKDDIAYLEKLIQEKKKELED